MYDFVLRDDRAIAWDCRSPFGWASLEGATPTLLSQSARSGVNKIDLTYCFYLTTVTSWRVPRTLYSNYCTGLVAPWRSAWDVYRGFVLEVGKKRASSDCTYTKVADSQIHTTLCFYATNIEYKPVSRSVY